MGAVLAALYVLVALSPLLVVAALWMKGEMSLMHETGTSAALAAYAIIALQPVLVARWKCLERPFGMDIMSRFHKYMGVFALALLLTHPPLMAYGGAGLGLLYSLEQPWYVLLGKALLLILIVHVLLSVFSKNLGLTFEKWRRVHNVLGVAVLSVAFVHSLGAGYDLGPPALRILWVALLGLTACAYIDHKILKPKRLRQRPYQVVSVDRETHNVWTVRLTPPEGERIHDYHPGQFHFLTFQRSGGLPVEEHHWTISSTPTNKDFISSTIKESGDFTATIGKTRIGDSALVEGPFGRFCYTLYPEDKEFVFIAGGIGITPLMSMIRHMRDTRKEVDVLLLYANRTEKDIAFRAELAEIEIGSWPRLRVIHILSQPEADWTGESGRVGSDKLTRLLGGTGEQTAYYICAPPPMAKIVIQDLLSMGVPYSRMRTEEFSL
ncbi:MAG: ferric reductase-like transmembrane domain-containing protein [Desulfomonile tiedjei]|nr:ferric reductase-like transmembrane domain-containing protein [Desulfomonile tiedjei]